MAITVYSYGVDKRQADTVDGCEIQIASWLVYIIYQPPKLMQDSFHPRYHGKTRTIFFGDGRHGRMVTLFRKRREKGEKHRSFWACHHRLSGIPNPNPYLTYQWFIYSKPSHWKVFLAGCSCYNYCMLESLDVLKTWYKVAKNTLEIPIIADTCFWVHHQSMKSAKLQAKDVGTGEFWDAT